MPAQVSPVILLNSHSLTIMAGLMAMPRTPINASEEDDVLDDSIAVDASLLPPG